MGSRPKLCCFGTKRRPGIERSRITAQPKNKRLKAEDIKMTLISDNVGRCAAMPRALRWRVALRRRGGNHRIHERDRPHFLHDATRKRLLGQKLADGALRPVGRAWPRRRLARMVDRICRGIAVSVAEPGARRRAAGVAMIVQQVRGACRKAIADGQDNRY
jgi:hypothetical protein